MKQSSEQVKENSEKSELHTVKRTYKALYFAFYFVKALSGC